MQQIIYSSRPFGFDATVLANILTTSRYRNEQNNITGALICRSDLYLQLLEGPSAQIDTTYERICADDRHIELNLLVRCPISDRLFPDWAMMHDPNVSWLWSPNEIHEGALNKATMQEIREVFLRCDTSVAS